MIFIKRDFSKVDPAILLEAEKAAAALGQIADANERKAFIAANGEIWAAFRPALIAMSHGKCWYSEASEAVSRYDVDHFRPKGRARISAKQTSDGYSWLAFDPNNYVLAAQLCNQANREYSDDTVGKANWFPLFDPSKAASLDKPDHGAEAPILLDPTNSEAPALLEFDEYGAVQPRSDLHPDYHEQIEWAIKLLGIRQTKLNDARRRHRRRTQIDIRNYKRIFLKPPHLRTQDDIDTMKSIAEMLLEAGSANAPFSALTRSLLMAEGLPHFISYNEYD